jgi:hypothetical protein
MIEPCEENHTLPQSVDKRGICIAKGDDSAPGKRSQREEKANSAHPLARTSGNFVKKPMVCTAA